MLFHAGIFILLIRFNQTASIFVIASSDNDRLMSIFVNLKIGTVYEYISLLTVIAGEVNESFHYY